MTHVREQLGFPPNPSLDEVRTHLSRHLLRLRGSLRVGSVGPTDRETIVAEIIDNFDAAVLHVEVDSRTGEITNLI